MRGAVQAQVWMDRKDPGFHADRKVFFRHRDNHSKHPSDILVSYDEHNRSLSVPSVTPQQALDAIKNIGMANMAADPTTVNPAHVLKAIDLMTRKQSQAEDLLAIMAKMMLGKKVAELVVIDGDPKDVTPSA